jgi:glycosyltransferase involved in cell wall biosynthesis
MSKTLRTLTLAIALIFTAWPLFTIAQTAEDESGNAARGRASFTLYCSSCHVFGAADVCVAPSRWEGLGLHLYEAMALGLPVITNDNPPMNEVVRDGENGLLVKGRRRGRAKSGIPAYVPSVRDLRRAMSEVLDPAVLAELRTGVVAARARFAWERTVAGYKALIEA